MSSATTRSFVAALGLAAGLSALNASAAIVTSRAALGGDDYIDWGQIAPTPVALANTLGSQTVVSQLGMGATVTNPPLSGMWRVSQAGGGSCTGFQFASNFAACDSAGVLLETWSADGTTNGVADNSAVFLGISRQQADIARLDFSLVGFNRYFGINRVELDRMASVVSPPGTVPEPSSLLLALLALPLAARGLGLGRRA